MSVLGIVTEYNPFHSGHLYHLQQSKLASNAQYCVCVMSGNFIQRGEPALIDKWARTKMALKCGVDLVIELPVLYSLQSAENFAYGSVKILDSLGIVDSLCFGSEAGNINILDKISQILVDEPSEFKKLLKENLNNGDSFPTARQKSLKQLLENDDLEQMLNSSNNILGIEYLKALKKLNSSITPFTINRVQNNYNSLKLSEKISSATSIRNELFSTGTLDSIIEVVPKSTMDILNEELSKGKNLVYSHHYDKILLSIIRRASLEDIASIYDVAEGLENRIKKASMSISTINDLVKAVKTKRYTQTRIQRILFHMLLGINNSIYHQLKLNGGPQYIRVLGFNQKGKSLLNIAKKKSTLPIITKLSNYHKYKNQLLDESIQYDITATNIYTMAYQNPKYNIGDLDYTHNLIMDLE